ncbi:MAG TPA: FAD-dependent oxidoreductase [Vicinamibacterales bacterium]|nr:FAD-dependent oxidoreductase [Vicinamibacterales bacterium]
MPKPAILAVDDDFEVLRAIERDLRDRYRRDYRILRAASGTEGLEVARELKQRGAPVALFLVDQRMPDMTGTELLIQAKKLHPDASRVLLTAYADTQAAISAINDVGLNHYLMKPWDPPEERLYPILDDLLASWSARVRLPYEGIRVVGSPWSPSSYATREFLSLNQVPYQWIDIEKDAPTRELVTSLAGEAPHLPVVLLADGTHLVAPSNLELAARIGLQTKAARPFYDVVIIGGGPAGLANAVYAASEGLKTLLVEQSAPGGQAGTSSMIENYLGFPSGVTGADLAARATAQARRFGAELLVGCEVTGIRQEDPYRIVLLADGREVSCYAVVIATGMSVRMLEVPGIERLLGAGVYYGAATSELMLYADRDIAIVGGANSAGQGAMFYSRHARSVTMIIRAAGLSPAMSRYLVDRITDTPNVSVVTRSEVVGVEGESHLERLTIRNVDTGEKITRDLSAMFIFIGVAPRTERFASALVRDDKGFIVTGSAISRVEHGWRLERDPMMFETSMPGVFAAGDTRSGANRRVAAAVGEGSAAIYSVHKYLETV